MHGRAARATRAGVRAMGLSLWARSEDIAASCVTAVRMPEGVEHPGPRSATSASATA